MVLFNVYAPAHIDNVFWTSISDKLLMYDDNYIIFTGDCNQTFDPMLDRHSSVQFTKSKMHSQFTATIRTKSLVDIWRLCNPDTREYSFYSPPHHSQSRIDYLFLSKSLAQQVSHSEIGSILISDHAPVFVDLDLIPFTPPSGRWCFNNSLLSDPNFSSQFTQFATEFFSINSSPTSSPVMIWDSFKAAARGFVINYVSQKKKSFQSQSDQLLD